MQPCIVKQPIHNVKGDICFYEILYSNRDYIEGKTTDEEAASVMEALLSDFSSGDFLERKTAFVTFTQNLILRQVPTMFAADSLVIQIDQDFLLSPPSMKLMENFKRDGYKIALVGFEFNALYLSAMNLIDYVKLSFKAKESGMTQRGTVEIMQQLGKDVIAYHVNSKDSFDAAMALGVPYMQGTYISAAIPHAVNHVDHLPGNFFQLMVAILREDPDLDEIEAIIARDVTLTYSLLKLVNSAFFSLRTKVQSVHQALVILGLQQLKQWIYLLSFRRDGNVPLDFIKLSLTRASFMEALHSITPGVEVTSSEAYLLGMFSTLSVLLQRPMQDILAELTISDTIKGILTGEDENSRIYKLYQIVLSYEAADWHRIAAIAEELDVPTTRISQKYMESSEAINELWAKLATELG